MSSLSVSDERPPVSPSSHPPISQPSIPAPVAEKDTILVVDDSINVRRFLALALEKAGYLVEQAKDGQDAVEKLLGGSTVCAVICDIEMPRLDGYGFLARIKSDPAYEQLPIAMLTSRTGDKHRQLAMTLGASAYFSKPYNERELLTTLKTIIAESRERKPIPSGTR
jgi:chemosensory pili system protein ChpA (sensor histidine kinase/response regulator)